MCKEVLAAISAAGTKGSEIRARFAGPPFGWHEDAIRGALMALLATRHIRAAQDGVNLSGPKQLEPRQMAKTTLLQGGRATDHGAADGRSGASHCGQDPVRERPGAGADPRTAPEAARTRRRTPAVRRRCRQPPDTAHIDALQALAGNQQFRAVADDHERSRPDLTEWRNAAQRKEERLKDWAVLESLLNHARGLEAAAAVAEQRDAIKAGRQLLAEPDPSAPAPRRRHWPAARTR